MPFAGSGVIGFWGTVRTMAGMPYPDAAICSASGRPLIRPWSRASTSTTSGRSCWTWASTFVPSVMTSRSLTALWAFSRPRMYCATCGTSSTSRRRVWSLDAIGASVPRRPATAGGSEVPAACRAASTSAGHEDRPVAAGAKRLERVVAADLLDVEAGVLGHRPELVGADESQGVTPDPALGRRSRRSLLVD